MRQAAWVESGFISPALVYLGNDLVDPWELGQTDRRRKKKRRQIIRVGWGDGASIYGALKLLCQGQGREGLSTGSYSGSAMVTASATVPLLQGHPWE